MKSTYTAGPAKNTYQDFLECSALPHADTEAAQAADLQTAVAVLREQGDFEAIELLFRLAVYLQNDYELLHPILTLINSASKPHGPHFELALAAIQSLNKY